ncbi:MAG: hypothetical protein E7479_07225 [Ruminococcaceae bacterium]|nr:hypothetical protein [Oscillospiraceae bacterium]
MKKLIAVIIALMLAVFASVFAFAKPTETGTLEPIFCVNPLYEGVVSVKKPEQKFENGINAYGTTYYTDIADVGAAAREHLKNRAGTFTVGYKTKDFDGTSEMFGLICGDILSYAFMHTGVSDEGDYIQWHWEHYEAGGSYSYNGSYYSIAITFYFDYYTTAAQEEAVTEKLEEVYEELQLEDKNDYYKICAIYDYICDNVVYDYANLNNENYKLQYTAYAALINGTSVCQGYSNLFYRMALDWGVDARLIAGDAGGGHAWNIVKMGDYYYNLDSTWDAGLRPNYMWFLKCPDTFVNHYRDYEYETAEFHAAYPMGATDYVYNESDFEEGTVLGDINGDAEQTVEDVYMIRLAVAKLRALTEEQKTAADLDGDGKITAIDANILRKYILGIIPEIPVAVDD